MALREGRASSCLLQHFQGQSSALLAKPTFCPVAHLYDSCQTLIPVISVASGQYSQGLAKKAVPVHGCEERAISSPFTGNVPLSLSILPCHSSGSGPGAPLRRPLEALLCSSLPTSSPRDITVVFLEDVTV